MHAKRAVRIQSECSLDSVPDVGNLFRKILRQQSRNVTRVISGIKQAKKKKSEANGAFFSSLWAVACHRGSPCCSRSSQLRYVKNAAPHAMFHSNGLHAITHTVANIYILCIYIYFFFSCYQPVAEGQGPCSATTFPVEERRLQLYCYI